MIHAIRAELTKALSLPSVQLMLAALTALHVLIMSMNMPNIRDSLANITADGRIEFYGGQLVPAEQFLAELIVAFTFQGVMFIWVIGAVATGTEFRSGQIGQSLLTVPSRPRIVAAKALAIALISLAMGVLLALVSIGITYFTVRAWDSSFLWNEEALIGHGRMIFIAIAMNLIALAVTLIARRTLVGIIAMAVFLGLTMTQVVALISPTVDALLPVSALRNLLFADVVGEVIPPLTAGPEHALITLTAWAIIPLIVAVIVLRRRDAR
ncbi:hypothetical protein B0O41_3000 [Propionibacteriaceae bacterium ES.041]|nr:hypothetical protein B0O41_3000 [Propionibacteriaceae bacterium ES.041]